MKRVLRPLVVLMVLMVGGCWEGPPFYAPSEAVSVIPPGRYEAVDAEGEHKVAHISSGPDRMTHWQEGDRDDVYGIAPLDASSGRFVVWSDDLVQGERGGRVALYALLQRVSRTEFLLYLPSCRGRDAEIASAAGAERHEGPAPECRFADRGQLECALRRLEISPEQNIRLTRLPDGPR